MTRDQNIKSVAVIGGGPSGLTACKALLAENIFETIKVFEQRASIGGIWNYVDETRSVSSFPSAESDVEEPLYTLKNGKPVFYSPIYKHLDTNVPNTIMRYNNSPYPEGTEQFPSRQDVLKYVQAYGEEIKAHISLNSQITSARKLDSGKWELIVRHFDQQNTKTTHLFDAIIIATSHYDTPFIPDTPGLKEWSEAYPDSVTHSKYFIDNKPYTGKRVLVIGNSASGIDLASQMADTAKIVYRSIRSKSKMPYSIETRVPEVDTVHSYDAKTKTIVLSDGSTLKDIDFIVYCTGYLYSFPYLKSYSDGENAIVTTGKRLHRIYKQIFYIPDPTLSFVAMSTLAIPFPLAETQAAVIARIYSGRLTLPDQTAMLEDQSRDEKERGNGLEFHELGFPLDVEYIGSLQAWANEAEPKEIGLHSEVWTDDRVNILMNCFEYKKQHLIEKYGVPILDAKN